jgi:hypothetical protein
MIRMGRILLLCQIDVLTKASMAGPKDAQYGFIRVRLDPCRVNELMDHFDRLRVSGQRKLARKENPKGIVAAGAAELT